MSVDLAEIEMAEVKLEEGLVKQAENWNTRNHPRWILSGLRGRYRMPQLRTADVGRVQAMKQTNSCEVVPQSERADTVLRRLLDASVSLWTQLTYAHLQKFFVGENVWDFEDYYHEYDDLLGSMATQQITSVNVVA